MEIQPVSAWKNRVSRVIDSKVDELKYLGFDEAEIENVWACLMRKKWKKDIDLPLHQVVEDIFHLNGHVFMSYLTMQSYQNDDLGDSISQVLNNH